MKKHLNTLLLGLVLVASIFLRFYKLAEIPGGVYVDEAAIGYNALSLAETGKDEFGKNYPIFFRSLGTYSSPLYVYFVSIILRFRELDIFSVRILSAASGVIATIFVYLITRELRLFKSNPLQVLVSLIFTTFPWTVFTSRGIHEPMFAFSLLLAGAWLWLLSEKRSLYAIPSLVLFAVSTYAYQAERLIVWLLVPILFWYTGRRRTKYFAAGIILFLLIQLPQILISFTPGFSKRASGLFYLETIKEQAEKISFLPSFLTLPLSFAREFGGRFLTYLSPRSLFFEGDPDLQRSLPELASGYSWMVIPYLMGCYLLFTNWRKKNVKLITFLALISITPAALTGDPFASLRALTFSFPLAVVITLGTEKIRDHTPRLLFSFLFLGVVVGSGLYLWRSYFILLPNERAKAWGYGFEELAERIAKDQGTHYLIDQTRIKPAYIELAFYWKYPPKELQKRWGQETLKNYYTDTKFDSYYKFANVETRSVIWEEDIYREQIIVGDKFTISEEQAKEHFLTKVFEIKDKLDEEVIFLGYQTDPVKKCEFTRFANERCKKN